MDCGQLNVEIGWKMANGRLISSTAFQNSSSYVTYTSKSNKQSFTGIFSDYRVSILTRVGDRLHSKRVIKLLIGVQDLIKSLQVPLSQVPSYIKEICNVIN